MTEAQIIAQILVDELIAYIDGKKCSLEPNKRLDNKDIPSIHCNAKGAQNGRK